MKTSVINGMGDDNSKIHEVLDRAVPSDRFYAGCRRAAGIGRRSENQPELRRRLG
ncbi:MAG: hypothetical protein ACYC5S_03345 [Thiobacillus sp.]